MVGLAFVELDNLNYLVVGFDLYCYIAVDFDNFAHIDFADYY